MSTAASTPAPTPTPGPAAPPSAEQPPFNLRMAIGLLGILIAAMTSGLNSRVAGILINDVQGGLLLSYDMMNRLDSLYTAGEVIAMPFASWCAITFSLRRFHISMLVGLASLAFIIPFLQSPEALYTARFIQGIFGGALIPVLMMAALRFLPPPIRLHGLALYALSATFSPNVALWLAGTIIDDVRDWRWVFWQVIPLCLLAGPMVYYGIPKLPVMLSRLKQANWLGALIGVPGLVCLTIAIGEGSRLDWFNSPLINGLMIAGVGLTTLFLVSEWFHPTPFIRLQILGRRNITFGFPTFFFMLIAMSAAVSFPLVVLQQLHGLKVQQLSELGLIVGVPQLVLGSVVSILLYQKWVDARKMLILGILFMIAGCLWATQITSEWKVEQFYGIQVLHMIGQPLAVVSLLFTGTSVVAPMEGTFVSGIINTLRALGIMLGSTVVSQIMSDHLKVHNSHLLDQATSWQSYTGLTDFTVAASEFSRQAIALAASDVFFVFACIFAALIPLVMCIEYVPAPKLPTSVSHSKERTTTNEQS